MVCANGKHPQQTPLQQENNRFRYFSVHIKRKTTLQFHPSRRREIPVFLDQKSNTNKKEIPRLENYICD